MSPDAPPPRLSPRATRGVRPFEGFAPVFGWGLRATLRGRRFLLTVALAAAFGALLGSEGFGSSRSYDPAFALWETLDRGVAKFVVPLLALILVAHGYAREVSERTLVYHLVRPVSRRTVYAGRYASGLVGASIAVIALTATLFATAGVAVPREAILTTAGAFLLGTVALGAIYYALAAIWRFGTIAGLVYTFLIESVLSTTRGTIQSLSVTFHVRSLLHRGTDDALAALMRPVNADKVHETAQAGGASVVFRAAERIAWDEPATAVVILLSIAAGALLVGAVVVSRRDYALKD